MAVGRRSFESSTGCHSYDHRGGSRLGQVLSLSSSLSFCVQSDLHLTSWTGSVCSHLVGDDEDDDTGDVSRISLLSIANAQARLFPASFVRSYGDSQSELDESSRRSTRPGKQRPNTLNIPDLDVPPE